MGKSVTIRGKSKSKIISISYFQKDLTWLKKEQNTHVPKWKLMEAFMLLLLEVIIEKVLNYSIFLMLMDKIGSKVMPIWNLIPISKTKFFSKRVLYLGPSLPENVHGASLLTSPNGKSVILIGGCTSRFSKSNKLFELSGGSTSSLKWHVLNQALVYPRSSHLSHYLSYEHAKKYSKHKISILSSQPQHSFIVVLINCLACENIHIQIIVLSFLIWIFALLLFVYIMGFGEIGFVLRVIYPPFFGFFFFDIYKSSVP